jgi:hypothetical protein
MVNGFHSEPIHTNRGVRQGDALSCALFILSMVPFILSIVKNDRIKGIKCADNLRVPVLVYADDTTVILEPNSDLAALLELFETFNSASNARINMTKSVLITVGNVIVAETGFQKLRPGETTKILGFPYTQTGLQSADSFWETKVESIKLISQKVRPDQLSLRGRILVLSSLVLSKAAYFMDLIPPPKKAITALDKLYFRALWDGKNRCPVDKRICQLPWDAGGINAKNIELWNKCKAALWVRKYYHDPGGLWQCILRDSFKNFKVQNGPPQLNGDPFIQHIKAQKLLPRPWKHILSAWKSLGGGLKKPSSHDELLNYPIWGNKHFNINETLNNALKKAFKKHPVPTTFGDLWNAEQGQWRVQETNQPLVNAQRQQALRLLMDSFPETFNLPAIVNPDFLKIAGMNLPNETIIETNEMGLKKIYYAWLMHKSTPIIADRMRDITWFLERNPKDKMVK